MASREIQNSSSGLGRYPTEELHTGWDEADKTGYWEGISQGELAAELERRNTKQYLIPPTMLDRMSEVRLRPNGKYKRHRNKKGINSPIDDSLGMREINRIAIQRVNSKR